MIEYKKEIENSVNEILLLLVKVEFSESDFLSIKEKLQYNISTLNLNLKECKKSCSTEQFLILEFLINPILDKLKQLKIYKPNNDYNPANGTATRELIATFDDELANMYRIIKKYF